MSTTEMVNAEEASKLRYAQLMSESSDVYLELTIQANDAPIDLALEMLDEIARAVEEAWQASRIDEAAVTLRTALHRDVSGCLASGWDDDPA